MYVIGDVAFAGEPQRGMRVESARVVNDLCMLVSFSTGETRLFDAAPLLSKPAFEALSQPEVFEAFSIDRGVLCWSDGEVDLSPEAVYGMSYAYDMTA